MGKYKKNPLDQAFAERLADSSWCENISGRVCAERGRISRLRRRVTAIVVFLFMSTAIVSAGVWQEDAAESRVYAMLDEASGDLTSQSLMRLDESPTRLGDWFE